MSGWKGLPILLQESGRTAEKGAFNVSPKDAASGSAGPRRGRMKTQGMRLVCREPSPVGGSSPWLRSLWRVPAT